MQRRDFITLLGGRLPSLVADLLNRRVAVIVCNSLSVAAAKSATSTTPIVFVSGDDPVKAGYVSSLNRPEGNLTGITFFGGGQIGAKRMELLRDLVPDAGVVAVLADQTYPGFMTELPEIESAGRALGRSVVVLHAESKADFGPAFERMVELGAGALFFSGGPFFTSERRTLAALALQHRLPSTDIRESVVDGVLMSYSASFAGAYRQAGIYVGKILKGAKPSDLPVLQPTAFELVINMKTAKALGIEIPASLMLRADELIE